MSPPPSPRGGPRRPRIEIFPNGRPAVPTAHGVAFDQVQDSLEAAVLESVDSNAGTEAEDSPLKMKRGTDAPAVGTSARPGGQTSIWTPGLRGRPGASGPLA